MTGYDPGPTAAPGSSLRLLSGSGTSLPKSVMRAPRLQESPREGRLMTLHTGRHFLQIPGPTNIPDRGLRAMDMPSMDHRSAEFAQLAFAGLPSIPPVFPAS